MGNPHTLLPPQETAALTSIRPPVRLLPRQAAFLNLYARGLNAAQAYREAYNPKASAQVASAAASRLLAKTRIRDYLDQFRLEAFQLVRMTYVDAIRHASRPIFAKGRNGQRVKVGEAPDWTARIQAAQALAELHDLYPKTAGKG